MKGLFAITIATIYGLCIRLSFGLLHGFLEIMSITFLFLIPFVIGYLTIILIPAEKTKTNWSAFLKPWITCFVILIITLITKIEGTICWIMIFPIFSVLAGLGGILAHKTRKRKNVSEDDWKNRPTLDASMILLIPILIGLIEGERTSSGQILTVTKEISLHASPTEIWSELIHINEVDSIEKKSIISSTLGFPRHIRTHLDTARVGGKRTAYYEKGLTFEETITAYEPERLMILDIKTDPDKISAQVMDEHILIGGKHLDILEDTYELQALSNGCSKLKLTSKFYINTPFNWYAGLWGNYLMSDILKNELELIKNRAEAK
jgi:hypothetical protein